MGSELGTTEQGMPHAGGVHGLTKYFFEVNVSISVLPLDIA